ncbi:MAG: aspartate/glutamate racemase family protein [Desulfobacterales bacterium]|nr:MAG: aspartate/glutamate racemase family protein [Desulfobacterales bacterium]
MKTSAKEWVSAPRGVRFDRGRHWRAKLGFVVLAMEQTIEEDVFRLAPTGVGVHFTRVQMANQVTVATLEATAAKLAEAAALLLPDGELNVVCFACTSASVVIGEDRVRQELARGAPQARVTTLITGVIQALRALKVQRIVVGTPYLDEINSLEARYLQRQGFDVLDIQGLNIRDDADMVRVAPDFIQEFARSIDRPAAEGIFISCGALRTLDIVEALEQEVGKPVVASNQAMIWETLRLSGVNDRIEGYGQLLRRY